MKEDEYALFIRVTKCLLDTNKLLLAALDDLEAARHKLMPEAVMEPDLKKSWIKRHIEAANILGEAQAFIESHGQFGLGKKKHEN
jgi:hypothetical protein